MSLSHLPIDELRSLCKRRIETLETWLRRLVRDKFQTSYGDEYFEQEGDENCLFNKDIRQRANSRMAANPSRYPSPIDALELDDLVTTLCKQNLFNKHFRDALHIAFPEGNEEARTFLSRLVQIRNPLAHANPISESQALRVLCYSNDVIESVSRHYEVIGMSKEFNSPTLVSFRDSLGNLEFIKSSQAFLTFPETTLRPGDRLRMEVDVDNSASSEGYTVKWVVANISGGQSCVGESFVIELTNRHVGEAFTISVLLLSKKEWHRHGHFDASLAIRYRVLPPL